MTDSNISNPNDQPQMFGPSIFQQCYNSKRALTILSAGFLILQIMARFSDLFYLIDIPFHIRTMSAFLVFMSQNQLIPLALVLLLIPCAIGTARRNHWLVAFARGLMLAQSAVVATDLIVYWLPYLFYPVRTAKTDIPPAHTLDGILLRIWDFHALLLPILTFLLLLRLDRLTRSAPPIVQSSPPPAPTFALSTDPVLPALLSYQQRQISHRPRIVALIICWVLFAFISIGILLTILGKWNDFETSASRFLSLRHLIPSAVPLLAFLFTARWLRKSNLPDFPILGIQAAIAIPYVTNGIHSIFAIAADVYVYGFDRALSSAPTYIGFAVRAAMHIVVLWSLYALMRAEYKAPLAPIRDASPITTSLT